MIKLKAPPRCRLFLAMPIILLALLIHFSSPVLSNEKSDTLKLYTRVIDGLDGQKYALSKWRGKIIIVNFWASWCGPCQYEIPRLKKWRHEHGAKGLEVVGIGLDDPAKLKNVARSLEIDYPLLAMKMDDGRPILAKFGNTQMIIPFTLVFNRDGTIAYRHKGLIGEDEFEIVIAPLL